MAQALMAGPGRTPQRIALLVKNLKMSGGNRVILNLFDRLVDVPGIEIRVFVVPEARRHLGELPNLFACKRRYAAATSVTRTARPVDPEEFDILISTSRRTLDFVADLSHPAHIHLFQAIEAWDTENSQPFLEYCRHQRYPSPDECIDLVRQIGIREDVRYVEQIASVRRFLAVSDYLGDAARYAGRPDDVKVCVPPLNTSGTGGQAERTIDVLLFLRGFSYNGDDVTVAVADALADKPYRLAIVAGNYSTKSQIKALGQRDRLSVIREPSDAALADLYASARVVVHPSLCNGGGFIPLEALSFGCAAVASRTGWLMSSESKGPLVIMDRHDPQLYLGEVLRLLENE